MVKAQWIYWLYVVYLDHNASKFKVEADQEEYAEYVEVDGK